MSALALTAGAGLVGWFDGRAPLLRGVAMLLAVLGGLTLPDIDQWLWPLDHRDALTHSLLPAAVLASWRRLRAVAGGLALGLALHVSADCFPDAMRGFATVKLPFAGGIGGWSYWWLAVNAMIGAVGFGLALVDQPRWLQTGVSVAAAAIGLVYLATVDGGWWVLIMLAALGWSSMQLLKARRC